MESKKYYKSDSRSSSRAKITMKTVNNRNNYSFSGNTMNSKRGGEMVVP